MSSTRDADGDLVDVDVTVPYADESRNHVLHREWQRQGDESLPIPPMLLPRHSEGSYRVRIRQRLLGDLVVEQQYSDAAAGRTGGEVDHRAQGLIVHLTTRGQWRFTSGGEELTVGPGTLMVRNNEVPWDFEIDRGTTAFVVQLPAEDPRRALPGQAAVLADHNAPSARLLLAHLHTWADLADQLTPAATTSARAAALDLCHALLRDQVIDDVDLSASLARAAMEHIDTRVLTDPDLAPGAIAAALHVSVRTLHRAFATAEASVMGYVLQRRLDRARAELLATTLTVAEVAARWHFTDSSHFIKAYRRRFGRSPAADRRTGSPR